MPLTARDGKQPLFPAGDKLLLSQPAAQSYLPAIFPDQLLGDPALPAALISTDFVLFKTRVRASGGVRGEAGGLRRCIYIIACASC